MTFPHALGNRNLYTAALQRRVELRECHLDRRVRALAQSGAAPIRLTRYAVAWEEIREAARETEVFNFDKRALVLRVFDTLAKAEAV